MLVRFQSQIGPRRGKDWGHERKNAGVNLPNSRGSAETRHVIQKYFREGKKAGNGNDVGIKAHMGEGYARVEEQV